MCWARPTGRTAEAPPLAQRSTWCAHGAAMAKNRIPAALVTRAAKLKYPAEFRAPLAAPLVRNKPQLQGPLDTLAAAEKREEERLKAEWRAKLTRLASHYGISKGDDIALALLMFVLADWVPGFAVINAAKLSGRPATPDEKALAIYEQIEALRLKSGRKELKRPCEQFKKATGDKRSARTLENIYRRGEAIVQSRQAMAAPFPFGLALPGAGPLTALPRKRTKTRSKSAQ